MKKIITGFLLSAACIMFTSCVVVTTDLKKHNITFNNDTVRPVIDWYVEDDDGDNYTISDSYVYVGPGQSSTMRDLWPKDYCITFAFDEWFRNHPVYYSSGYVYLDSNTDFYLSDESFYERSAVNSDENKNINEEPKLFLTDGNGNKIPLYRVEK